MFGPIYRGVKLAASPRGRKLIRGAVVLAQTPQGKKVLAEARRVASSPEGRRLLGQAVNAATKASKTAAAPENRARVRHAARTLRTKRGG
jgi:hypothetical protein